jgi:hypothetical protein
MYPKFKLAVKILEVTGYVLVGALLLGSLVVLAYG